MQNEGQNMHSKYAHSDYVHSTMHTQTMRTKNMRTQTMHTQTMRTQRCTLFQTMWTSALQQFHTTPTVITRTDFHYLLSVRKVD